MRNFALALLLAVLSLSGCKREPKVVGNWTSSSTQVVEGVTLVTNSNDTFNADGTFKSVSQSAASSSSSVAIRATDTGRWKLEGDDKLTVTIEDIQWEFPGLPPDRLALAQSRFASRKAELIQIANRQNPLTITWNGDESFSYTVEGVTYTETRVK